MKIATVGDVHICAQKYLSGDKEKWLELVNQDGDIYRIEFDDIDFLINSLIQSKSILDSYEWKDK